MLQHSRHVEVPYWLVAASMASAPGTALALIDPRVWELTQSLWDVCQVSPTSNHPGQVPVHLAGLTNGCQRWTPQPMTFNADPAMPGASIAAYQLVYMCKIRGGVCYWASHPPTRVRIMGTVQTPWQGPCTHSSCHQHATFGQGPGQKLSRRQTRLCRDCLIT